MKITTLLAALVLGLTAGAPALAAPPAGSRKIGAAPV